MYTRVENVAVGSTEPETVRSDLGNVGGDLRWYGLAWAWELRRVLGRLLGEDMRLQRPDRLVRGARVDWWEVGAAGPGVLVLFTNRWVVGEAWLGYTMVDDGDPRLRQVAVFRPRGTVGLLYWTALRPVHRRIFRAMVRHRAHHVQD